LANRLDLKINEHKSAVDRPWNRTFLGFSFYRREEDIRVRVAKQALDRCQNRLRQLTRRTQEGKLEDIIQDINAYTMGWIGYFQLADTSSGFVRIDKWLRRGLDRRWRRSTWA
jgi:hypothetical protein